MYWEILFNRQYFSNSKIKGNLYPKNRELDSLNMEIISTNTIQWNLYSFLYELDSFFLKFLESDSLFLSYRFYYSDFPGKILLQKNPLVQFFHIDSITRVFLEKNILRKNPLVHFFHIDSISWLFFILSSPHSDSFLS